MKKLTKQQVTRIYKILDQIQMIQGQLYSLGEDLQEQKKDYVADKVNTAAFNLDEVINCIDGL
jgi:hypothetical protein